MSKRYIINIDKKVKDEYGHTIINFSFFVNGFDIKLSGVAQLNKEQMKDIRDSYSNIKGYLTDQIRNALNKD